MVMHARKIPKLNDGYCNSSQAHSFEKIYSEKNSNSYSDRYGYENKMEPSKGGLRLPNRPVNKSTHNPRQHEKETGSVSVNVSNTHYSQPGATEHLSHKEPNRDNRGNTDQIKLKDHKAEIRKSAIHIYGDWSEHLSSSGEKYYYNCRTKVSQWERPKEWTDFNNVPNDKRNVSYNSLPPRTDDRYRQYDVVSTVSSSGMQYSSNSMQSKQYVNDRSHSHNTQIHSNSLQRPYNQYPQQSTQPTYIYNTGPRPTLHLQNPINQDNLLHKPETFSGECHSKNTPIISAGFCEAINKADQFNRRDMFYNHNNIAINGKNDPGLHRNEVLGIKPSSAHQKVLAWIATTPASEQSQDEEEIPPQVSQLYKSNIARPLLQQPLSVNTSQSPLTHHHHHQPTSTDLTKQAIETLQKLQEALIMKQKQQQLIQEQHLQTRQSPQQHNIINNSNHMTHKALPASLCMRSKPHSPHTSQASPQISPHPIQSQQSLEQGRSQLSMNGVTNKDFSNNYNSPHSTDRTHSPVIPSIPDKLTGNESPHSDRTAHSREGSPVPSDNSCHDTPLPNTLAAAASKPDSILSHSSLTKFFDEKLIQHIIGWTNDAADRQACRYAEEAHCVGSMHCTQVSVELKNARSLVRIAEIQATVQEQRVLFLQQQIKELECVKSNSYMSFSGT